MRRMLINDVEIIFEFYEPVGVKDLTNQFIFCTDISF